MGNFKLVQLLTYIVLATLVLACNPIPKASPVDCEEGYTFNTQMRKCEYSFTPPKTPVGNLNSISINEGSTLNPVLLSYTDENGDLATTCWAGNPIKVSDGLATADITLSACNCAAGACSITVDAVGDNIGFYSFDYTVTDQHGTSATKTVSVQINNVQDPAVLTQVTGPLGAGAVISITEDTFSPVTMNYGTDYTDVDQESATSCSAVFDNATDSQYMTIGTCSCTAGLCTVNLTPKADVDSVLVNSIEARTTIPISFTVSAGGMDSNTLSVPVTINSVNDVPRFTFNDDVNYKQDLYYDDNTTLNDNITPLVSFDLNALDTTSGFTGQCSAYDIDDDTDFILDTEECTNVVFRLVADDGTGSPTGTPQVATTAVATKEGGTIVCANEANPGEYLPDDCTYTPPANKAVTDDVVHLATCDATACNTTEYIKLHFNVYQNNDAPQVVAPSSAGSPDVTITEDVAKDFTLTLDEGYDAASVGAEEDVDEDSQLVYIKVTETSGTPLLDSITVKYDGVAQTVISDGGTFDGYYLVDAASSDVNDKTVTLTLTPKADLSGSGTFDVEIRDNADQIGSSTGYTDGTTVTYDFTITDVNDAPTISIGTTSVEINEGAEIIFNNIVIDEGGDGDEDSQALDLYIGVTKALVQANSTFITAYIDADADKIIDSGETSAVCAAVDEIDPTTPIDFNGNGNTTDLAAAEVVYKCPLGDAAASGSATPFIVVMKTIPAVTGDDIETIVFAAEDDSGATSSTATAKITVNPVNAQHGGWTNVMAVGAKYDRTGTKQADRYVKLEWDDFNMIGFGSHAGASISGYNIYRRMTGSYYDFENPLNGSSLISTSTKEWTDTTAGGNTTYYYLVRPVDSVDAIPTATTEVFSEIRVHSPVDNMVFVHRWVVNKSTCEKMHLTPDATANFSCTYSGPGSWYDAPPETDYGDFDLGSDLLVDMFETGCPFTPVTEATDCGINGCIGIGAPAALGSAASQELFYYDRSYGKCYRAASGATTWTEVDALVTISADLAKKATNAFLPPMTNVAQDTADLVCQARAEATVDGATSATLIPMDISAGGVLGLPTRLEQVAYAAWHPDYTDSQVTSKELGSALDTTSACNTSSASGVDTGFTDSALPLSGYMYSLPGTDSSGIRSIYTGSTSDYGFELTTECISRFGVQDAVGNVKELSQDGWTCGADGSCLSGGGVSLVTDDHLIFDGTAPNYYGFDGNTAPLLPAGSTFSWEIRTTPSSMDYFSFPIGMPVDATTILSNIFGGTASGAYNYILQIGNSTTGISSSALHNDKTHAHATTFANAIDTGNLAGSTGVGTQVSGGSYISGGGAGVYSSELVQQNGNNQYDITDGTGTLRLVLLKSAPESNYQLKIVTSQAADSTSISGTIITLNYDEATPTYADIESDINTYYSDIFTASNSANSASGNLTFHFNTETRSDIGFRCDVPLLDTDYTADSFHNYSY